MKINQKTLKRRQSELAYSNKQLKVLNGEPFSNGVLPTFKQKLETLGMYPVLPKKLKIFQVNVGYVCNQVCEHCHVDAGPDRKEAMTKETMEDCLRVIKDTKVSTVDITGGAPEMNPNFRWFIEELTKLKVEDIIVRTNLTIIQSNKRYSDLPAFYKDNKIHLISSLPCYTKENVDRQRGEGVFSNSIEALRKLNEVGYGREETGLKLDLVYNPGGASLPGSQEGLENDYKRELKKLFGIEFNQLFTIANLPISRFLDFLLASERYEDYMTLLVDNFNPYTVEGIMCRDTISVGWNGKIYDCDFNQMLELPSNIKSKHIAEFDSVEWNDRKIVVSQHCYGCTAGAGSSCQGTVI